MNAKKMTMTALVASLLVSASYGAVFAKDGKPGEGARHHHRMEEACGPRPMMMHGPAGMFIYALQQFDTNKDGKISKDEAKAAEDTLFAAIDTNKDGVLTPGELKKFRQARMEAWKAEMPKPATNDDTAKNGDDVGAPPPVGGDAVMKGPMDGCGPRGPGHHGHERHGMHEAMRGGPDGRPRGGPDGMRGPHPMMAMMGFMRMMDRVDTDENGQISKAEADAALDKLFTRLDTNKDGFISADDFPKGPSLLP